MDILSFFIAVFIFTLVFFFFLLIGLQVNLKEVRLLTLKYNYRPSWAQLPTLVCGVIVLFFLCFLLYISERPVLLLLVLIAVSLLFCAIEEWILARINPRSAWAAWIFRFACCSAISLLLLCFWEVFLWEFFRSLGICQWEDDIFDLSPLCLFAAGIYLRNSPFGAPYIKNLCIETYIPRRVKIDFSCFAGGEGFIPETKYAGKQRESKELPRYDVRDFGVKPNSRKDQTGAIQQALDRIGGRGGGVLYFPKGRYNVNKRGNSFLQINFSNITIEGETDPKGRPLATIVCCRTTVRGNKNPWLSPFMITTGELLQPSNEFWGIDFRRKKQTFMQSNSLSDPGSDGKILSPELATTIVSPAKKGESTLQVEDSSRVGKYILLGLYNTSADGNLIKDILGMSELRPEWTVALRAGEEQAPSYQWLTEVKRIIDPHTIELVRPLLRDIDLKYSPVIYNADMLENISIRNIRLASKWSGLFRHHGFPLYYSVKQTQEMDYGWNAINMKRTAHGEISNVIIENFTNPLYITDSRNISVSKVKICGHDGHQGVKLYCHACDNLIKDIVFTSHFADMMGGEGNAYGNVFADIRYLNPEFNPVDYDFHGFAPPSAAPPAGNLFMRIYGFRYMKHAGAITHLPSAARGNTWYHTITEGERRGEYLFYNMTYRQKNALLRIITAVGYAVAIMQKTRKLSAKAFLANVKTKLRNMDEVCTGREKHTQYIPESSVIGIKTTGKSQF